MKDNEKLVEAIAVELREQHKLLMEAAKRRNPKEPIKGFDLEAILERHQELASTLEYLKMQTEAIKKGGVPGRPREPGPVETRVEPPKLPPKPGQSKPPME